MTSVVYNDQDDFIGILYSSILPAVTTLVYFLLTFGRVPSTTYTLWSQDGCHLVCADAEGWSKNRCGQAWLWIAC